MHRVAIKTPGLRLAMLLLGAVLSVPAGAVRIDSLYAAEVDLLPGSAAQAQAFEAALSNVLVKVSGLPALGEPAARRSLVPDAGRIVRQYSRLPGNRLRVEFDSAAVRAALDGAGQPVWGDERPLVAIWYAVDEGNGQRDILADEGAEGAATDELRERLAAAANDRGLPVVFPLLDTEDLATVSFSDIWGGFADPVQAASARYGADAVLIGRARDAAAGVSQVRWLLVSGAERIAWEGPVEAGPQQAAEALAQSLATYAKAADALRLQVDGVDSLDRFGRLQAYLRGLDVVRSARVTRVRDSRVEFELIVRGDAARLSRSLDSGGLLVRGERLPAAGIADTGRRPDLAYAWAADQPAP